MVRIGAVSGYSDFILWHHLARELALTFANVDDHPLAVDVGDLEIERLLTAEARAVVQSQQRPMLDVHLCIEQGTDFLATQDRGQLAPYLGLDDFLIEPRRNVAAHAGSAAWRSPLLKLKPGEGWKSLAEGIGDLA